MNSLFAAVFYGNKEQLIEDTIVSEYSQNKIPACKLELYDTDKEEVIATASGLLIKKNEEQLKSKHVLTCDHFLQTCHQLMLKDPGQFAVYCQSPYMQRGLTRVAGIEHHPNQDIGLVTLEYKTKDVPYVAIADTLPSEKELECLTYGSQVFVSDYKTVDFFQIEQPHYAQSTFQYNKTQNYYKRGAYLAGEITLTPNASYLENSTFCYGLPTSCLDVDVYVSGATGDSGSVWCAESEKGIYSAYAVTSRTMYDESAYLLNKFKHISSPLIKADFPIKNACKTWSYQCLSSATIYDSPVPSSWLSGLWPFSGAAAPKPDPLEYTTNLVGLSPVKKWIQDLIN